MKRRRFLIATATLVGATGVAAFYWPRRWKYIVVHHSAGQFGTIDFLQQVHRDRQPGDPIDAIPYHYVIGNGNGLGICLVGNFEESTVPKKQFDVLVKLTKELMNRYNIPSENVLGHGLIERESTKCPGSNFPFIEFKNAIGAGAAQ